MKATDLTLFLLASYSLFSLVPSPEETLPYQHQRKLRYGSDTGTLLHHQPPLVVFYELDQVDERLGATGVIRLLLQPRVDVAAEQEEEDDEDNGIYSDRSYRGDWDPNDPVENPFGMDLPDFLAADPEYSEVEEEVPLLDYSDEDMPELVEDYSDEYEGMPELVEVDYEPVQDDGRSLSEVVGAVDSDPIPVSDEEPKPVRYCVPFPSEGYTGPAIYDGEDRTKKRFRVEDEDGDGRSLSEVFGACDSDPIPGSDEDLQLFIPTPVRYCSPSPPEGYMGPAIYDEDRNDKKRCRCKWNKKLRGLGGCFLCREPDLLEVIRSGVSHILRVKKMIEAKRSEAKRSEFWFRKQLSIATKQLD